MRLETRGSTLAEIVVATALAGILLGLCSEQIVRQHVDLRTVRGESQARSALLSAYERLRSGLLKPPRAGAPQRLDAPNGMTLTLERAPSPPASPPEVVAVRLRVVWTTADRDVRQRELTTLFDGRGAR